jgi:hypothetical protein
MGETEVVRAAASHGWEAALLAFTMIASMALLVFIMKAWMSDVAKREERMSKRIDELEKIALTDGRTAFDQLITLYRECREALDRNSLALQQLTYVLRDRPCLLPSQVDHAVERVH